MDNLQLATHNTHFLQAAENLFRHALGKIDEAVILVNIDVPDVAPLEARLIRNRADDISGLHTVCVSDFDTVRLEGDVAWRAARLARGALVAATTIRAVRARRTCITTMRALVATARSVIRMVSAAVRTGCSVVRTVRATVATDRCVVCTMRSTTVPTGCACVSAVRNAFWAVLTSCPAVRRPPVLARLRRRFIATRLLPRMSA
jgi:hypothetical protein